MRETALDSHINLYLHPVDSVDCMRTFKSGTTRPKEEIVIAAIHDADLVSVTKKVGVYEDLAEGKARCLICERPVSLENLGGLIKVGGRVRVVCEDPRCIWVAAKISRAASGANEG